MRFTIIIWISFAFLVQACKINNNNTIPFPEGGYNYPRQIEEMDKLNYIYPIKDSISSRDSFNLCTSSEFLYKSFQEPNLSIKPPKRPVFRFVFQHGFSRYAAVITLQEEKLVIKELETGYAIPYSKIEKLDSLEEEHYWLLSANFPVGQYEAKKVKKNYLDSMTKLYPQLLDPRYYRSLLNKTNVISEEKFTYNKREIPLTKDKYNQLVRQINESGYWKMKPIERNCIGEASHTDEFSLEAATSNKYNFVTFMECMNDTSKLTQVCTELRKISKMDENMDKWHTQLYNKKTD